MSDHSRHRGWVPIADHGGIASTSMSPRRFRGRVLLAPLLATVVVLAAACGDSPGGTPSAGTTALTPTTDSPAATITDGTGAPAPREGDTEMLFPDVLEVVVTPEGGGRYRFDVTLSSPYDSPERYADGWRVLAPDGTVLGERPLLHDHASEQPFTRSLAGVEIPEGVSEVTVQGRDQVSGWGGAEVTVPVPGR